MAKDRLNEFSNLLNKTIHFRANELSEEGDMQNSGLNITEKANSEKTLKNSTERYLANCEQTPKSKVIVFLNHICKSMVAGATLIILI